MTAVSGIAAVVLLATACGSSNPSASSPTTGPPPPTSAATSTTAAPATTGSTLPAYVGTGSVPAGEPDVNGDRKVVIGILSPGDTHDHGYYESFVDSANSYAAQQGWKVITLDKVPDANALQQAENLCRQGADMVAIGAGELADGLQAASQPVCAKSFFYISGGSTVKAGPTYTVSIDSSVQSGYASGVAAGLLMKSKGSTKAGFVAGINAPFNTMFYVPWAAGLKSVLPGASTIITYSGDENDSAKAVEAFKAQQAQGVQLVYPYLGGSTYAVAALANQANIPTLTPGTDNCASSSPKFDISVIFSPGDYFGAILKDFKAGDLKLGVERQWRMGLDPVPTVKFCQPTGDMAQQIASTISGIGNGSIDLSKVPTGA